MRLGSKVSVTRLLAAGAAALLVALVFAVRGTSAGAVSWRGSVGPFGHVSGRLVAVGGLANGVSRGVPGRVVLTQTGTSGKLAYATGPTGAFNVPVPAGFTYRVTGYSPKVMANGREERCAARHTVRVPRRPGSGVPTTVRDVEVICPVK